MASPGEQEAGEVSARGHADGGVGGLVILGMNPAGQEAHGAALGEHLGSAAETS